MPERRSCSNSLSRSEKARPALLLCSSNFCLCPAGHRKTFRLTSKEKERTSRSFSAAGLELQIKTLLRIFFFTSPFVLSALGFSHLSPGMAEFDTRELFSEFVCTFNTFLSNIKERTGARANFYIGTC